nr:MAG TPA_asm: hypothetical protein [Caudoviricetes sp.]
MKQALKLVENFGGRIFKCRVAKNLKPAFKQNKKTMKAAG